MSSSLSKRRFTLRHPVVVDVGCSCRRSKLASLFSFSSSSTHHSKPPKPNPHTPPKHHHPLSSYYPFSPSTTTFSTTTISPWEVDTTSSNPSPFSVSPPHVVKEKKKKKKPTTTTSSSSSNYATHKDRVAKESVAVVKESQDPFHDFRDSMLQMILEKEIYAMDDLRDLLQRFLSLNSPYHHDSILRAFSEIWSTVFSSSSPKPTRGGATGGGHQRRRRHHHHHRRLPRDPHV